MEQNLKKRWGYFVTKNGRLLHRVICRQVHGPIPHKWVVHHIDGQKLNNHPSNLIAIPDELHCTIHQLLRLPDRERIEKWLQNLGSRPDRKLLRQQRKRKKIKNILAIGEKTLKETKLMGTKQFRKFKTTDERLAEKELIEAYIKANGVTAIPAT